MAKQSHSFSVKYAIVCDDIRKEDSGKFIFIGVYNENIIVPSFPFNMTLAFWMSVIAHKEGEILCQWKIKHDKVGDLSMTDGKLSINKAGEESSIVLRKVPVQVPEEGILSLYVRENEGRWRNVKSIRVSLPPNNS